MLPKIAIFQIISILGGIKWNNIKAQRQKKYSTNNNIVYYAWYKQVYGDRIYYVYNIKEVSDNID